MSAETAPRAPKAEAALYEFAANPGKWGNPEFVLTGQAAADYGRSLLETAGADVAAVERRVGRPRVDRAETAPAGVRSPRVNVAITQRQEHLLDQHAARRGVSRSELVREAIDDYLRRAS